MTDDDDAGAAFERAAARAARLEDLKNGPDGITWVHGHRYRAAVGRFVLVLFLLPAHIVAARGVTGWLIAHLVVLAILATQVVKRWMTRRDGPSAATGTGLQ